MKNDRPSTCPSDRAVLKIAVALILIAFVQIWVVTAGFYALPNWTDYTSRLASAFLHGQFSLLDSPPPPLLALPNPYDPRTNYAYRLHDAVLFQGKYYLYWGPAPALLLAVACLPMRIDHFYLTDAWVVIPLMLGTVVVAAILMLQVRARFFPTLTFSATAVPLFSFGVGGIMLYTIARPAVYEVAIFEAQFFLLAGFCFAFAGMVRAGRSSWLVCAGILWAASVACRVSLLPAVAALELITLICWRRTATAAIQLIGPLVATIGLLGAYNFIRFHHWAEFGYHLQLAGQNQHAMTDSDTFSIRYLPFNLQQYLFALPRIDRRFPFVRAFTHDSWVMNILRVPRFYNPGQVIGLVWTQPFLVLTLPGLPWLRKRGGLKAEDRPIYAWLVAALAATSFLAMAPILMFQSTAMRFFLDGLPCAAVLSAIGFWKLMECIQNRPRLAWRIRAIALILMVVEFGFGLLLGTTGDWENFRCVNPALYAWLYKSIGGG